MKRPAKTAISLTVRHLQLLASTSRSVGHTAASIRSDSTLPGDKPIPLGSLHTTLARLTKMGLLTKNARAGKYKRTKQAHKLLEAVHDMLVWGERPCLR